MVSSGSTGGKYAYETSRESTLVDLQYFGNSASYSYRKPDIWSPYSGAVADQSFPYTQEIWNRPQALWTFAAKEILGVDVSSP